MRFSHLVMLSLFAGFILVGNSHPGDAPETPIGAKW